MGQLPKTTRSGFLGFEIVCLAIFSDDPGDRRGIDILFMADFAIGHAHLFSGHNRRLPGSRSIGHGPVDGVGIFWDFLVECPTRRGGGSSSSLMAIKKPQMNCTTNTSPETSGGRPSNPYPFWGLKVDIISYQILHTKFQFRNRKAAAAAFAFQKCSLQYSG